jgi:filamentous hemagglutinin family protein
MHRPDTFANRAGRRKVARLLAGCALAPVLAALPQVATAQAFAGTPTVVSGFPTFNDGPGVSTINLKGTETVINWTPFDTAGSGAIDFLPAGNFALFNGPAGFTVLNRVLPVDGSGFPSARAIALNGRIDSTVGRTIGGNVWFYSPTGIIVGPTATITVGGLVLTTNDIVFDPANTGGTELYGPNNTVLFRGPAGSKGLVDVQASNPGAGITAASYVALVAPRVQQAGMISANGPIGYVGAEQADISINAGLFDISILAGTTDPNGVVHTGTTTGPASTGGTDQQQIMMVAMPKSTALTMLLSGSIGYAPAISAFDDGSSVILSAGYDKPVPTGETADSLGHIKIDDASFLNPVNGYSTGTIDITGPASFGSNAYLFAQDAIDISLTGSESFMSVADFLSLNAARKGQGGKIDISVGPAATLTVGSYVNLNASANSVPYDAPDPVDANGGMVTLDVDGGEFSALGGLSADVSAFAGAAPVLGGTARAGSASFTARNGGTLSATSLGVNADAFGGASDDTAGDAFGGTASLTSHGGVLDLGPIYFEADAFGGQGFTSGAATGGKAAIVLDGGTYNWDEISAYTDAHAGYEDGWQGNGATGRADAISLTLSNGAALTVAGNIDLTANAFGTLDAPAGASVHGGGIALSVSGGSSLGFANLTANAQAGVESPLFFFSDTVPARTPDALGGTISLTADGGAVTGQSLSLLADATELAASDSAGTAHGGMVDVNVLNGGSLTLFSGEGGGGFTVSANGYGAVGQSAANAIGGTATLTIADGSVDVNGLITVTAGAFANNIALFSRSGSDPVGFDATGGTASVQLLPGANLTATDLFVDATGDASTPEFYFNGGEFTESGYYGGPFAANGGTGTGGTATLNVGGGNLLLSSATVSANGQGGLSAESGSGTPFRSGDGHGGTAGVTISGGSSAVSDLYVSAAGFGGDGSSTGPGGTLPSLAGDGYGGTASLTFSGGTLQADTLTLDATGTGGVGGDGPDDTSDTAGTDGGKGVGGTARLASTAGSTGQLTSPTISILATGTGGVGGEGTLGPNGNGGDGVGGTAMAQLADGAFDLGPLNLQADGYGGDGEVGGVGSGGSAQFILSDSAAGPSGARTIDGLQLSASGSGGFGTGGSAQSDAGSALLTLNAHAGTPLIIDGDLGVSVEGARSAAGDGFTASFSGEPVQVTGNTAIYTTRDATITSTSPLQTAGNLSITARKLSGTGQFSAGGSVLIDADQGIALDKLSAGTTTSLQAANGAILVATDLESGGDVSATGRSIDITSLGALNFTTAQATAGNLAIATQGNLTMTGGAATGNVDLSSAAGSFSTPGTISGGGNVSIAGRDGVTVPTVVSGGTTHLAASNGAVSVASLTSPGAVTASGRSVDITSPGALTFASADATAGNLRIATAGNLVLTDGSASGTVNLTSSGGSIASTGLISSGGGFSANGATGLNFASLSSGGTTTLNAPGGAIVVTTDLQSAGAVSAVGRSIDISSFADLSFANAQATAGNLQVASTGNLAFAQASATGAIGLNSGGLLSATGPVTAGGAVNLAGANGLSFGSVTSGGTTALDGGMGTARVTNLVSPGAVTAIGNGLDIASSGALNVTSFDGGAGTARIATVGNLAVGDGNAMGGIDLSSSAGAFKATGQLLSNGDIALAGDLGVTAQGVSGGGAIELTATDGAISVADLSTPGAVTAAGRSSDLFSTGALTLASASATAGDLKLNAGQVTATGPLSASANVAIDAANGISLGSLTSGGTTALAASGGAIKVTDLQSGGLITATGLSIDIGSSGALTFADAQATAGDLRVTTAGDLILEQGHAAGDLTLTSGRSVGGVGPLGGGGPLSAGGDASILATIIDLTSLDVGGATTLTATTPGYVGWIRVHNLSSGGEVRAKSNNFIVIDSPGSLSFTQLSAPNDISVDVAGDLRVTTPDNLHFTEATAGGSLNLTSSAGLLSASDSLSAGGAVNLFGATGLTLGSLTSGGTTSLVSAGGPIHIVRLGSAGLITADAHGPIDIGSTEGLSFDSVKSLDTTTITAAGDLAFNTIDSGLNLTLSSTGGGITVTGDVHGGFTRLSSLEDITLGGALNVAGSLSVDSRGALVVVGDTFTDDAGISADGGITMAGLRTGESTGLRAVNGNIRIANLDAGGTITAEGLDIDIASTGSLNFLEAQATQDNLAIRTGGDLTAQRLLANHDIALTAGGTFALSGEARGVNIAVTSRDIDLGGEASLGVRGTTSEIALFNGHPSQETFIGGAASESGYSLDADEALHLFADKGVKLGVAADELASDEGHVTVGDLHLAFGADSGNIGSGGYLEITSPTEISILGNVALTTGSENDRFIIDPTRVELNTETGSIALLDGSGNPLGRLDVTGDTVAVGTGSTLDQLRGLTDMAAINTLLGAAGGKSDPLRAGSMIFRVADGLFIQNSGASTASADRRGFTTNALDIFTGSPATKISINGVIVQNGTPVTGLDTAPLVTINEVKAAAGGQFDPLSTINGCGIGLDCAPPPPPPPPDTPDDEFTPPPNDDITPPVTPVQPGGGLSGTLVQLEDNQPLITPPLVDEPITGVGNDDLWVAQCTDPQQEGCPQQDTAK